MREYHDREWGVPIHDDRRLFELLVLEGAQAGLSWMTVLRRREGYRNAFAGFDPRQVANFDERRIATLLADTGIIRNQAKIRSAVGNARAVLAVTAEAGSLAGHLWGLVGGAPLQNRFEREEDLPASTPLSTAMSRDLVRRGFRFVGPTICYAFMQSAGMVNDHVTGCFRHAELALEPEPASAGRPPGHAAARDRPRHRR
jgi:DNA-3-methyladenine glycosylase I